MTARVAPWVLGKSGRTMPRTVTITAQEASRMPQM
jgi:hypothetical protein